MPIKEFKFSEVSKFIRKAFPEASSRRKVVIKTRKTYFVSDYWDGGSRNYCKFINLHTGEVVSSYQIPSDLIQKEANPHNLPIATINLSADFAVIEHTIFCGKDLGYRIYVGEDNADKLGECMRVPALSFNQPKQLGM